MPDLTTQQIFTLDDSIYLLTSLPTTWGSAQVEAQDYQGNLVTINNEREQTFLAGLFAGKNSWIGYNDSGVEGTFEWISGERSAYKNWGRNQPDNFGDADFVYLNSTGGWDDIQGNYYNRGLQGIIEIKNPSTPILVIEDLGIIEPVSGSKEVTFSVRRFGNNSSSITVNYSTANDTAYDGINYTATSGTLTFAPGEVKKEIKVTVLSDADRTTGENFFVNLSNPSNAILGDNQAKATIREAPEAVTFGGKTYVLTEAVGNWGEAQVEASKYGGNLVTINTPQEQAFLAGKYAGQNLWIGLSDAGKEDSDDTIVGNNVPGADFLWFNGEKSIYRNWERNQPDNFGDADFVYLNSTGGWDDIQSDYYNRV